MDVVKAPMLPTSGESKGLALNGVVDEIVFILKLKLTTVTHQLKLE